MGYFGKYKAIVVDVTDKKKIGRVKVHCGEIGAARWALPCFKPNEIRIPRLGDIVWIEFEQGIIAKPVWTGVIYTQAQMAEMMPVYDPSLVVIKALGDINILSDKAVKLLSKSDVEINNTPSTAQAKIGTLSSNSTVSAVTVAASNDITLNGTKVVIDGDKATVSSTTHVGTVEVTR